MDKEILDEYDTLIKNKISQTRFDSAINDINKLLSNFPKAEFGYYYRGVCEFALEKYTDSIKSYLKAVELQPAYGKAYFNLGVSYFTINQYDNALINIAKALIVFSKLNDKQSKARCYDALKYIQDERRA